MREERPRSWLWTAMLIIAAAVIDHKRHPQKRMENEMQAAPAKLPAPPAAEPHDGADPARRESEEPQPAFHVNPWPPFVIGVLALAGMGAFVWFSPKAAAGGWLMALVFCSSIPIGSVFALMIHALTGGRWVTSFRAVFIPSASALWLIALFFVPVLTDLSYFYSWASTATVAPADVSQMYLNQPFFIARSATALIFWCIIGLLLPRLAGTARMLVAAIALALHALIIGVIGLDWILSLEPVFFSSSFGATLAFTQFAAALAWAAILSPRCKDDIGVADVSGLLLATLLGLTYLNFIAFLVIWYGDLPHKASWFAHREQWPWRLIGLLAFIFGAVVPIFLLFLERVRSSKTGSRRVGAIALAGIALYFAYLIAPPFGELSLGAGLLAAIAIGGLLIAYTATPWGRAALDKRGSRDDR